MTAGAGRRAELADALTAVRRTIATAERAAGRPAGSVTLIAVTKAHPVEDLALLAELGVTDVGESRADDLAAKRLALGGSGLRWHMIGQVQRRKAAGVAASADVVHSVDRAELAAALSRAATAAARVLDVLIQVDLDPRKVAGRGGADPADVPGLADLVDGLDGLRVRGVMAVASQQRPASESFDELARVAAVVRDAHPAATWVSAGMSGDLAEAIGRGATHVRVGTALLGARAPVVG